jgi:iron-sulfur cluster assembly accessory protein
MASAPRNKTDIGSSISSTSASSTASVPSSSSASPSPQPPPPLVKAKSKLKPLVAAVRLTPAALERLRALQAGPNPKYIRIGTKNKGCAGMVYHLDYVDAKGKFDEEVTQDGITVLVDNRALFGIIGSEMDWVEDRLSNRFV